MLTAHSHLTPPPRGNSAIICMYLIFLENKSHWPAFLLPILWVYLHLIFFCGGLQKTHLFWNRVHIIHSRSSKVDNFGGNRKRLWDFLLVAQADSNLDHILHCLGDMVTYWLKIGNFPYPSLIRQPPLPMLPLEFRSEGSHEETRVMGLSYSEDRMIADGVILTSCDGQADRRTDLL